MIWIVISVIGLFLTIISLSIFTGHFQIMPGNVYDTIANKLIWEYDRKKGSTFYTQYDEVRKSLEKAKEFENQDERKKASEKLKVAIGYYEQVRSNANSAVVELSIAIMIKHIIALGYTDHSDSNEFENALTQAGRLLDEDPERYYPAVKAYYDTLHQ